MKNKDEVSAQTAGLRQRAEEIIRGQAALPESPGGGLSLDEIRAVLYDLRVHQVELEMQNEELRRAQVELDAARARYFDLYDMAPVGYFSISQQGLILEANLTAVRLLGKLSRRALVNLPITYFILKQDQDIYYLHRKRLIETGEAQVFDVRMLKKDDTQRVGGESIRPRGEIARSLWVQLTATAAHDDQGALVFRVVLNDISERKRMEAELQTERDFATQIIDMMGQGLTVTDSDGCFEFVNPAYARLFGYEPADLIGKYPWDVTAPEEQAILAEQNKLRQAGKTGTYESRLLRADGSVAHVLITGVPRWNSGSFAGSIAVITDISERKAAEEEILCLNSELEKLVVTDYLTNLYNRRYFMQRGADEFKRANRNGPALALLMLDIDKFKKVNDTYGHEAGDIALRYVAEAMKSNLREIDVLGRMGGEEFAVLLPNTLLEDAALLAERVRQSVESLAFFVSGEVLIDSLTISVGAAVFTDEMTGIDDLLRNADTALYRAKHNGRNCVVVF